MRVPLNRLEKLTGVFLLVAAAFFVAWFLMASQKTISSLFSTPRTYYVVASTGLGTTVGSSVMLYDVNVGTVSAVSLVNDPAYPGKRVRFAIKIEEDAVHYLTQGTTVVLGGGLPPLAAGRVELHPSGTGQLKPGTTLVAEEQVSLLSVLTNDTSSFKDQIQRILTETEATLRNVHEITDGIKAGKGLVGRVMSDQALADNASTAVEDVRKAVDGLDQLMANVNRTADGAPALMKNAVHASTEADKAITRINTILEAAPELVAALGQTIAELRQLLATVKHAAGFAPELARKVDSTIEESQRLIEALQKNFLIRGNMPARPDAPTRLVSRPPLSAVPSARPAAPAGSSGEVRTP